MGLLKPIDLSVAISVGPADKSYIKLTYLIGQVVLAMVYIFSIFDNAGNGAQCCAGEATPGAKRRRSRPTLSEHISISD